jgi:tellurite resistance protein
MTASPQEVESKTLASVGVALSAIGAKAPDEVDAYRHLVLGVAKAVAAAKGGVKPDEAAALDRIKEALGA